jgi:CP family cyanate transporter-like MFS transporter
LKKALQKPAGRLLLAVAIFLISLNLRPAITAVGPVLEFIRAGTGLSAVLAGALTSMPLLAFALMSPLAPALGSRFGMERAIFIALLLLAFGILLRSAPSVAALYAGSALLAAAIAIGNVLVPGLIKRDFPDKVGTMTSVYATTLAASASIASAVAVPLAGFLPGGWRGALGVWCVPAIITVFLLLSQLRKTTKPLAQPGAAVVQNVWHSKLAWNVTLFMGLQSMSFYTTLSWLSSILQDQGYSALRAGYLVALFPALGIPVGFIFPAMLARFADQRGLAIFFSAMMCAGYLGMIVSPQFVVVWVVISGLALGFCFPLALAFFALRAHDTKQASALSGMAQSIGYGIAAAGPVLFGALHDLTHGWIVPLWMLAIAAVAQGWVGWNAGRKAHV